MRLRERGWGEGSDGGERGRGEKGSVAGGYKTRCAGGGMGLGLRLALR